MKMNHILLVEDDLSIIDGLEFSLRKNGFDVDIARTVKEAFLALNDKTYDLLILDLALPDGSGFEICKKVRRSSHVPIIFLTASDEEVNIVMGLDMGGDDYITKPIKPALLVSKVNSLLRRLKTANEIVNIYEAGDLKINRENYMVYRENQEIQLARKEFELLNLLASKPHKVFTRDEIMNQVWDDDIIVGERTIDVHIRKIREKTGIDHIKTIKGVGYKFDPR